MSSYVLDASVAAKWFLPPNQELFVDQASRLLRRFSAGDCRFVVPDLFWSEMGNILWKAVRNRRMSEAACEAAITSLESIGIATFPCRPLLRSAMDIAVIFDRTLYDSMYVALAVESNAPLLTADERLANALATLFPICWLGALPS